MLREPLNDVVLGVQGAQASSHFARGLHRYVEEYALALAAAAAGRLGAVCADAWLPEPGLRARLPAAVPWRPAHVRPDRLGVPFVYHVLSPFEEMRLTSLWPHWARAPWAALAVTLHDVIPLVYPERYLPRSDLRTFYAVRSQLLAAADVVLAISQATAKDARERLGVDPGRIAVVGAGVSDRFQAPAGPRAAVLDRVRRELPAVLGEYVLYTGGIDHRKNVEGLIDGYAALPAGVRATHQLVVAGHVSDPLEEARLRRLAARRGVGERVVFTRYVPDDVLVRLYQACDLFVMPSRYEGFGLPLLEAARCGAAVIGSDAPAVRDLLPGWALFPPDSRQGLAALMAGALTDRDLHRRLRDAGALGSERHTWAAVAARSLRAYDAALRRRAAGSVARRRAWEPVA